MSSSLDCFNSNELPTGLKMLARMVSTVTNAKAKSRRGIVPTPGQPTHLFRLIVATLVCKGYAEEMIKSLTTHDFINFSKTVVDGVQLYVLDSTAWCLTNFEYSLLTRYYKEVLFTTILIVNKVLFKFKPCIIEMRYGIYNVVFRSGY